MFNVHTLQYVLPPPYTLYNSFKCVCSRYSYRGTRLLLSYYISNIAALECKDTSNFQLLNFITVPNINGSICPCVVRCGISPSPQSAVATDAVRPQVTLVLEP